MLVTFPAESLSDGTSPPPTGGFIDTDDIPAWDTWVYFDAELLFALIPPDLVSAVDGAIWANAYNCIGWLGFRDHPLVKQLRRAGISEIFPGNSIGHVAPLKDATTATLAGLVLGIDVEPRVVRSDAQPARCVAPAGQHSKRGVWHRYASS